MAYSLCDLLYLSNAPGFETLIVCLDVFFCIAELLVWGAFLLVIMIVQTLVPDSSKTWGTALMYYSIPVPGFICG